MFLYIFKIIIKLIITSSRFDPSSTSVRPQNPWTSPFYGSMNGPGLKTLLNRSDLKKCSTQRLTNIIGKWLDHNTHWFFCYFYNLSPTYLNFSCFINGFSFKNVKAYDDYSYDCTTYCSTNEQIILGLQVIAQFLSQLAM